MEEKIENNEKMEKTLILSVFHIINTDVQLILPGPLPGL